MCIACVRDEIQVVTLPSQAPDTRKEFFAVSERGGKAQNTVEKVALQKAKTPALSTVSENATTESTARKTGSGGTSASDAARADRGKATGSSDDDHREGA